MSNEPETVTCLKCKEKVTKADAVLIKNRYHCRPCLAKSGKTADEGDKGEKGDDQIVPDAKADRLDGMKAICAYAGRSECTIIDYARRRGFPAQKIGGIWISHKSEIDAWWKNGGTLKKDE